MACTRWNDDWIAVLYEELDTSETETVRRHLATCEDCRSTLDALEASRTLLRESAPAIPFSPRVVLLDSRRRHPFWTFAGGMAAAAALFLVALTVFPGLTADDASREALEARLARIEQQNAELLEAGNTQVTREEFQQRVKDVVQQVNVERAKDFEFLLGEIAATEWRTGNHIRNNNDVLLQTMLAGNPRFTEQ